RLGQGVTPDSNAAVLLWQAMGPHPEGGTMPAEFFRELGIAEPPEKGDYFIDLARFVLDHLKGDEQQIEVLNDQLDRASARGGTAKQYPHRAAWLKANEKPLALVVRATRRPHYFSPLAPARTKDGESAGLITVLLPGVQKSREFGVALAARALLHAGEGRDA